MTGLMAEVALRQVPRILGLCDRDSASETFGCCDRYYWHYRLLDLPNARFQEVCWLLALLYVHPFDPRYYRNSRVLEWIGAQIEYWLNIRNNDGSVNEVYPFERSFCATSFSTLAITESLLLLGNDLPFERNRLKKTGDWLIRNGNPEVSNQEAACLAALRNLAELLGDARYEVAVARRKADLLKRQHVQGFFPEYGGMDIGYLSITLSLLALFTDRTPDAEMLAAGRKAAAFLEPRIAPDGCYDNTGTSRRTQYLYPAGLARFTPQVLGRLESGLARDVILSPQWMDDRYCIAFAIDYLLASRMSEVRRPS